MAAFGFNALSAAKADVVWPPPSWNFTPLNYYLLGAAKDKCYADKPETIDALKDNIRKAIGEIQLHTIDNVLTACPVEATIWTKLFSIINGKDCTFK